MPQSFPYEASRWAAPGGPYQTKQWLDELERIGTEAVRFRLADFGSAGSHRGIGAVVDITKGFAEEWLCWKDAQKRAEDERYATAIKRWAFWAAVGALIAAAATAGQLAFQILALKPSP